MARLYRQTGEARKSLAQLETVLKQNPGFIPALIDRGRIHLENGEVDAAARYFREACGQDQAHPAACYLLALAEIELESFQDALDRLNRLPTEFKQNNAFNL